MAEHRADIIMSTITGAMVLLVMEAWFLVLIVLPRFCGNDGRYPTHHSKYGPECYFEDTIHWALEPRTGWLVFAGVLYLFLVYALYRGVVTFFRGST